MMLQFIYTNMDDSECIGKKSSALLMMLQLIIFCISFC